MHVAQLLYLMVPAYVANMTPPFVRFWPGWNRPISVRWLGSHKTVLGAVAGVAAGVLAAYAQSRVAWAHDLVPRGDWGVAGLSLGVGAIGGDLLKSFLKRRVGIAPGARWIPADQLDFVLGALALIALLVPLSWSDVGIVCAVSFVADVVVNHVAHAIGIRETAW